MTIKTIGIIGVGGVGDYFGGKLGCLLKGANGRSVSFIARRAFPYETRISFQRDYERWDKLFKAAPPRGTRLETKRALPHPSRG